jgi:hypothetical protein
MRAIAIAAFVAVAACGGTSKPTAGPTTHAGAVPLVGLEAASFGDSVEGITAAFPGAQAEGDRVWLEHAWVENLPAVVMFDFERGSLRTLTVAFDTECDLIDDLGALLDGRLGKRTNSEADIAAWNHSGWDLALYCANSDAGEFPRLDVRPSF